MPTILIKNSPPTNSLISEYVDIIFICNTDEKIIYNSIEINNLDQVPIDNISFYIPYPKNSLIGKIHTNVSNCDISESYNDFTEISLNLPPQQVLPGASLKIELCYKVKCFELKTMRGIPVYLSFYNLNYIKDSMPKESLNSLCIPPIDSKNIHLSIVCSKDYAFTNVDSTPEAGNLFKKEDHNNFVNKAIEKIAIFCPNNTVWSEFLLWGSPQLSTLPKAINPEYSGRAVKAYIDKKINFVYIGNMKFSHPDIINLIIALISLAVGGLGIYFSTK